MSWSKFPNVWTNYGKEEYISVYHALTAKRELQYVIRFII